MAAKRKKSKAPTPFNLHVGAGARGLREAAGLTQDVGAGILEVCPPQLSRLEKGQNRFSAEQLYRLARAYDVPLSWFLTDLPADDAELKRLKTVLKRDLSAWQPAGTEEQQQLLLKAWSGLPSDRHRQVLLTLAKTFAERSD